MTPSTAAVTALCRTVGCRSVFSRWSALPHRLVCTPLVLWLVERDERRQR